MNDEHDEREQLAEARREIEERIEVIRDIAERHEGEALAQEAESTATDLSAQLHRIPPVREDRIPPVRE